jgi:hypothetical protein
MDNELVANFPTAKQLLSKPFLLTALNKEAISHLKEGLIIHEIATERKTLLRET